MNTKYKYLLGGIIFVLCACVGFLLMKSPQSETNVPKTEGVIVTQTDSIKEKTVKVDTLAKEETNKQKLEIVSTEVQKVGDSYSLRVICINVPANVVLKYEIPDLRLKNSDGYFTRIPGRKSGSYIINVTNSATGEVLASKTVYGFKLKEEKIAEQMSSSEFQALLLNQGDNSLLGGKHPKVARSISLSFEGLRDDDRKPGDILAVREKIAYGIWRSAKVVRVGYDANGKINSARIQPIY